MPSSCVKHLNPRQGITTSFLVLENAQHVALRVKHLNPRQGITTRGAYHQGVDTYRAGVKHLNPRQGITTLHTGLVPGAAPIAPCETPKSPPGDYNPAFAAGISSHRNCPPCETPKSPPGDYNDGHHDSITTRRSLPWCETPKSPPGDYNRRQQRHPDARDRGVKHLNPRQGITTITRSLFRCGCCWAV